MSMKPVDSAEAAIESALSEAFGNRHGTVVEKLDRAGKKLPGGVRDNVGYLQEVRKRIGHPRRRGQLDRKQIESVKSDSLKALGKVDISRDKARRRLNWLGGLVLNLMLFAVVYYFLLGWLGAI